MTSKIEMNNFNTLIYKASNPNQVQVSKNDYAILNQGESGYYELLDSRLQEKAEEIADQFTEMFEVDSEKIQTQINTYEGLLLNYKNVAELYLNYKKENIELIKDVKNVTSDVLTNERKTFYQDQKIDGLKNFYFYILLGIYIICFVCFVIFTLVKPSQSSFTVKIASIIGFLVLPFVSKWILGQIIYLIYKGYELLPKNVYQ
jgi:hypothetical protein